MADVNFIVVINKELSQSEVSAGGKFNVPAASEPLLPQVIRQVDIIATERTADGELVGVYPLRYTRRQHGLEFTSGTWQPIVSAKNLRYGDQFILLKVVVADGGDGGDGDGDVDIDVEDEDGVVDDDDDVDDEDGEVDDEDAGDSDAAGGGCAAGGDCAAGGGDTGEQVRYELIILRKMLIMGTLVAVRI